MLHPGRYLANEIKQRQRTQKQFADLIGKKVSELNELINGKRNITIAWDIVLCFVLDQAERTWIAKQNDYDYYLANSQMDKQKRDELKKRKQQIQKHEAFTHF